MTILVAVFAVTAAAAETRVLQLQPHHVAQTHLEPGITHAYAIPLAAEQYIRLAISAAGSEFEISFSNSKTEAAVVGWIAPGEISYLAEIGKPESECRLELKISPPNTRGQYAITVEEVRNAVPRDRVLVQAENLVWRGKQLLREQKAESYRRAIEISQQSLDLSRSVHDGRLEAQALIRIGEAYSALSDAQKALGYFNQALSKWRLIGDLRGQSETLDDIGGAYFSLGDRAQAIKYLNDALTVSQSAAFARGEAAVLNDLGVVYQQMGDYKSAVDYLERSLHCHRELGDSRNEGEILISLGISYDFIGMNDKAIEMSNQGLRLVRSIHDRHAEATALNNLAAAYSSIGEKQKALDSYADALSIEREVGDHDGEARTLNNLGGTCRWPLHMMSVNFERGFARRFRAPEQHILGSAELAQAPIRRYWRGNAR